MMAGDFRQLRCAIWLDPDWRTLTVEQQHTYLMLLSHPKLNAAGVIETPLDRTVDWAADLNIIRLRKSIKDLIERRYILQDEATVETLVRSYVRYDGMMKVPNQAVAVAKAWRLIESPDLQHAVLAELARLHDDEPSLAGWKGVRSQDPDLMIKIAGEDATVTPLNKGSSNRSGNPPRKGSKKGSGNR